MQSIEEDIILKTRFGSQVYGTSLPSSDEDWKTIFIPKSQDILLQRAPRIISTSTKIDKTIKNTSSDVDEEMFALHEFLRFLKEGQTICVDILFVPEKHHLKVKSDLWLRVKEVGLKLLNNKITAFVEYCRSQSNKYGIKGSRVAAMRSALEQLSIYGDGVKVEAVAPEFEVLARTNEHIRIVNLPDQNGGDHWHIEVCNRKMPFTSDVKFARKCFEKIFNQYGERALLAEKNKGLDYKALCHAVRIAGEAKELLMTGTITFPRPDASILLKIRKGELKYKEIADMIDQGLVDLEEARKKSILPNEVSFQPAEDLIYSIYGEKIISEFAGGYR